MLPHVSKFGIYYNDSEEKVVRITSPYWFPEPPEWIMLTDEANATILAIREIIRERGLSENPDRVTWGRIPAKD